jgi:DNA-binding NarL/FixJ family response regulator
VSIRVLLADDHTLLREGLRTLLDKQAGIEVVGESGDGHTALRLARELSPDVVMMDVSMPDLNGIEATQRILAESPDTKVIGLSMHAERRLIARMLQAGASGYLLKNCGIAEIVRAVRDVVDGQTVLSPQITGTVVEGFLEHVDRAGSSGVDALTSREREVLQLLAEGKSVKEVADHLHLSTKTVHSHRYHIMEKLNLHTTADLTRHAIREGLTSLDTPTS